MPLPEISSDQELALSADGLASFEVLFDQLVAVETRKLVTYFRSTSELLVTMLSLNYSEHQVTSTDIYWGLVAILHVIESRKKQEGETIVCSHYSQDEFEPEDIWAISDVDAMFHPLILQLLVSANE